MQSSDRSGGHSRDRGVEAAHRALRGDPHPPPAGPVRRRPRSGHVDDGDRRRPVPRLLQAPGHRRDPGRADGRGPAGRGRGAPRRHVRRRHINTTEDRAVLHVALRMPRGDHLEVDGHDVVADVHAVLDRMGTVADRNPLRRVDRPHRPAASPRWSTSASAAPTSARPWPTRPSRLRRPRHRLPVRVQHRPGRSVRTRPTTSTRPRPCSW